MIKSNVKLSVAVITYNQKDTISSTLNSILSQEHDYIYEVIVGDDCSTDGTRDILLNYQTRYPENITLLLNETNLGVVGNYFNVIQHCSGEYIMQCAGDDWWLPNKVNAQIHYMDTHAECGMCYTKATNYIQERGCQIGSWGGPYTKFGDLIKANTIPALTIVARTHLMFKYIDEISPMSHDWKMEDYPMWLWFAHNSQINFIDKETSVYRVLSNSASHYEDVEKTIAFSHNVIDIQSFFYEKYTSVNFDVVLQKWKVTLHKYAIYNRWKQFICLWWAKVKECPRVIFCIKPYIDLVFFVSPYLRSLYRK